MSRNLKIFIVTIALLLSGHYSFSANKQLDFLPFEFDAGNMVVKITINNKSYNFLFTSTGYSSISNEIIKQCDFKVNTANQTFNDVLFYTVKELKIGNTFFRNIDARALNTNEVFNLKCKKIDGIIGADLLTNRIWKIDYNNKKILFSDSIQDFEFSKEVKVINFKTNGTNYSPIINLNINNSFFENVKVNIGFNGSINLPLKDFKGKIDDYKNVKYNGTEKFSVKSDVILFSEICVMIPAVTIGKQDIGGTMINFYNKGVSMIGNKILKDYDLTIDWKNKKIYLDNYTFHENYKIEDYGFYFYKREGKIEVVGIYVESNADKQGLKNGDVILKINDVDFTKISEEDLCDLYFNFKNYFKNKDINVTVLRDSKEYNYNIAKQIILN